MKQPVKRILAWLLVMTLCLSLLPGMALAALVDYRTGTASYGEDVFENVVINWGTRGTNATFLSPMAEAWYETTGVSYEFLSSLAGSSDTEAMTGTELYQALRELLLSTHTNQVTYDQTRSLYAFADCQKGDTSTLTCFYTGQTLGGWDSGSTWNREHTWPQSKGMKDDEETDEDDIVMLRPAASSANSSRGNKAYGEGDTTKFYDPNSESKGTLNVRGDVARSLLYGFIRWENTSYMWGENGVIESPELLLRWMQEDPVDTWEMGRNDSVESVTGVRNVFIDYPELAFVLLGEQIPNTMITPSGEAVSEGLSYTITAVSGNEAWGEVFVSGTTINAAPNAGYEVQGYTVVEGDATVTRNGNAFSVSTTSDCTIRIDFQELDGYDVRFHENGTLAATETAFAGDSIALPEAYGEAPLGFSFLGWVTGELTATTQKPAAIYAPGTYVTITGDVDYYALYSFLEEGSAGGNTYQLYSGDITEGNYLITYENGALKASITNSRLDFTTISPVNGVVANPDADLVWKIAFEGSYVTLYNESVGKYAASTGAKNKAKLETAVTDNSRWTPSGTETYEFVNLQNQNNGVNCNLRKNAANGFATYATSTGGALTLYKQGGSTLYYSTSAVACEHTNTLDVEAVAPSCTQSGYTAGVRCADCNAWISGHEAIDALGHSYEVVETAPTCTEKGKAVYTCSVCASGYTTTLAATGHSYEEGICTVCGAEDPNFGIPTGQYVLVTDLAEITAGGEFVIAVKQTAGTDDPSGSTGQENEGGFADSFSLSLEPATVSDSANTTYTAMGITVASGKIAGVDVTVEDNMVISDDPPVWTIEAVEGGVALSIGGSYIKWSSGTSFASLKTPYTWLLEQNANGFRLLASTTGDASARGIIYRLSADKFAPYATSNETNADYIVDLQLFKYVVEGAEDCEHSYSEAITAAPGCEAEGVKTFTCTLCGTRYTESIPATGHTNQPVAGTAPTCTEGGLTDGVACSVCGKAVVPQQYIPFTGHSYVDGICSVCGAEDTGTAAPVTGYVLVNSLADVTAGGQFVIAVNNAGSWQAIGTSMTSGKLDGLDVSVTDNVVTMAAPPVWTIEAVDGGVALSLDGQYLGWAGKTNFAMQAKPYTWVLEQNENGSFRLVASTSLSETTVRSILYYIQYDRFGPYAKTNETKPEYGGELQLFKYQTAGGDTEDCEHSYSEAITTEPGCEAEGVKTFTCDLCGDSYTESIPATGHTEQPVAGTAPTCTENGLTDGTECSVCGKAVVAQQSIPATGHSFVDGICSVCGTEDTGVAPSVNGYVLVQDLADVTAGGKFVVAVDQAAKDSDDVPVYGEEDQDAFAGMSLRTATVSETAYTAMASEVNSKKKIDGVDVAVSGNLVTSDNPPVWTVEAVEGGVALSVDGQYLAWIGSTNLGFQADPYAWALEQNENGSFRLIASTSLSESTVRSMQYYVDYNRFGPYSRGNETKAEYIAQLWLFKYQAAGGDIEECQHSYSEAVTTEPGCESEGVKTFTCDLCGNSYTESIPATGHSYEAVVTEPTATEQGYTTYTCQGCGDSYVDDYVDALGMTLTGSYLSYLEGDVTLELVKDGKTEYTVTAPGNTGDYAFTGVLPGSYILKVSKHNHVTREYEITVDVNTAPVDVKIHPIGDINGDGRVTVADVSKAYAHVKKTTLLTGYEFLCADIISDGRISTADVSKAYAHTKKTTFLW